jgi:hypothetical protein
VANVTWNPADKAADLTLSNGDTTVTRDTTGAYRSVRGNVGHTDGLRYFEAFVPFGGESSTGIAMASMSLNDPLGYGSDQSAGVYNDGTLYANNGYGKSTGEFDTRRAGFLVNLTTRKMWVKADNGQWSHGGDPASGGSGIDISHMTGPLFPAFCGYHAATTSTLYSEAETITLGLPAGASFWGASGGTTPVTPTRKPIRSGRWY